MRTLNVQFSYILKGSEAASSEFDYELSSESPENILQEIADKEGTAPDRIEITGVICSEDIGEYENWDKIFDFAAAYSECNQDAEIVVAALALDIPGSDIDEAYQGEFSSDEEFAREMADQLGAIDKNATWPQNCIDWEYAAKEVMYDYAEKNGHYFRNL